MKRLSSSDPLIPICPSAPPGDEKTMYGRGFPPILDAMDDDECGEEELCSSGNAAGAAGEKKRRLSTDQVRALEKNFEVENKLDPERKVRLAQELGLQPRQVAVWFQNRRARWKTKQLERDYSALKASYDALKANFDALYQDKQSLVAEIKELKDKLGDEESFSSIKEEQEEEPVASESDVKASEFEEEPPALIYKDGLSDSDSSAVLNDDTSPYNMVSSSNTSTVIIPTSIPFNSDVTTNTLCAPPFMSSDARACKAGHGFSFQHQLLKAEEHGFEEPCSSFFSDDQAPTLPWYCPDQWNHWDYGAGGENGNMGRREGPF